ncbi:MAG: hypothetical protein WAN69_15515 [Candidatus Korobacteraceae bacterium]
MSLEKWVEYGWLKSEATSPDEIRGLLSIIDRGLDDSKVEAISTDLRFIAAFNSALTAATIALRANGYRTSTQAGHHVKTIDSLELTIPEGSRFVQKLKALSNKRNRSSYDVAGVVSDQDLGLAIKLAAGLQRIVQDWLRKEHPELLKT